ncbi:MAG TPA: hemolysin family protein [Anaeromyxobacteraceae bacterium]|nr:hemolysin family protein [Anaeromyxobacteraceae bacterium]
MGRSGQIAAIASAAVVLLMVRALLSALEAALVATGLTGARMLAEEQGVPASAHAVAALLERRESSAATLHALDVLAALGAGALAAVSGMRLLATYPKLGAALALLSGAGLSLLLCSAGRTLGARKGAALALAIAIPFRELAALITPIAGLLARLARPLAGADGTFALPRPPLEELERGIAEHARLDGTPSDQSTSELIHAVLEFRGKVARDVMVPRTGVVALDIDSPVPEILRLLAEEGHSRMPVYRENLDHVVGILHARDLVPLTEHRELIVLRDLLRPPHFVPWSKPIDLLLREMQRRHIHMGIVVDEYGGVMGICTLEDVLEEIVGEIGDEFEQDEKKAVEAHPDGTYTARGDTPVAEFNRLAGADLPVDAQYETLGGFLNTLAGAIPVSGDRFFHGGWLFTVSEATPRRALKVRAARVKRAAERDAAPRKS